MNHKKLLLTAVLTILSFAYHFSAWASSCVVTWTHATIQDAISDPICAEIYIPEGTYYDDIYLTDRDIELKGIAGGDKPIIMGQAFTYVPTLPHENITHKFKYLVFDGSGGGAPTGIVHLGNGYGSNLILEDVEVKNFANSGIYVDYIKSVEIYSSIIKNNQDVGVFLVGTQDVLIDGSTISHNASNGMSFLFAADTDVDDPYPVGAGIGIAFCITGSINIVDTAIRGNTNERDGGAIYVPSGCDVSIDSSNISSNTADLLTGGIYLEEGSSMNMVNSTVSGNTAWLASALYNHGNATITSSTIYNNRNVLPAGGAIHTLSPGSTAFQNTIVSHTLNATTGSFEQNCDADTYVTSAGHNISNDTSCGLTNTGDMENTDPLLRALADNGGETRTHMPRPFSPAIDAGHDCPAVDQRLVSRPQDGNGDGVATCDIGSVEVEDS